MSKYPDVITRALAEKNKGHSDAGIEQDIADTEAEISTMEKKAKALDILVETASDQFELKMCAFKRDCNADGIANRKDFIVFLQKLLDFRKQQSGEK